MIAKIEAKEAHYSSLINLEPLLPDTTAVVAAASAGVGLKIKYAKTGTQKYLLIALVINEPEDYCIA